MYNFNNIDMKKYFLIIRTFLTTSKNCSKKLPESKNVFFPLKSIKKSKVEAEAGELIKVTRENNFRAIEYFFNNLVGGSPTKEEIKKYKKFYKKNDFCKIVKVVDLKIPDLIVPSESESG